MVAEINSKSSNPSKPKGSTSRTLFISLGILIFVLVVGGYFVNTFLAKRIFKTALENALETTTGKKVDIESDDGNIKIKDKNGSLEAGTNAKWPSDLPSGIPQYQSGKISMSLKSDTDQTKGWNIIIAQTSKEDADEYLKSLLSAGFTQSGTVDIGMGINMLKKGKTEVTLVFDPSSSGVSITISEKK